VLTLLDGNFFRLAHARSFDVLLWRLSPRECRRSVWAEFSARCPPGGIQYRRPNTPPTTPKHIFFSRQKLNLAFYLDFLPVPGDIVVSTPQITPSFLLLCFGDVRDRVPVQISTQTVLAVILICQINIFQNVVGFVA
jgi:hypothetical protein